MVLGTSWLGYELAWYDLVRVRVDWKPVIESFPFVPVGGVVVVGLCTLRHSGGHAVDINSTAVTASTPIVVSLNQHDSVAAVLGLRMRYTWFYELFMESTRLCDDGRENSACNLTCLSDVSRCLRRL